MCCIVYTRLDALGLPDANQAYLIPASFRYIYNYYYNITALLTSPMDMSQIPDQARSSRVLAMGPLRGLL